MINPGEAVEKIIKNEILNQSHLIDRLCGERSFPIELKLKLPTQKEIVKDVGGYQKFIWNWRSFPHQHLIKRRSIEYRYGIDGTDVPEYLVVNNWDELFELAGEKHRSSITGFMNRCRRLEKLTFADVQVFYRLLRILWEFTDDEFNDLCVVYPQLHENMGQGRLYVRSLPVNNIDTKFIERHENVIWSIIKAVYASRGKVLSAADLGEFLGVVAKPNNFINMIILDPELTGSTNGYSILKVSAEELFRINPPGTDLLVVENEQSGYMLPPLKNTVAIFGTGKNLGWAGAPWIKMRRRVVYWGDIDSWGYAMLADFRKNCGIKVPSIMMNSLMIDMHADKMAVEDTVCTPEETWLTPEEIKALKTLERGVNGRNRLEQEKIDQDVVIKEILRYFSPV